MASTSTSTSGTQPDNENSNAFQELVRFPSTSISIPGKKLPYDVFINHRGPDVKHTLAATLYKTLSAMGVRAFLDEEELQLGDCLPKELQEAMQSASLHIAIFSKNYAESPWCLAELAYMLRTGTPIIPIFYRLQPSDIRYDQGLYTKVLSRHKKKGRYSPGKVEEWKDAIKRVSYNKGEIISNEDDCARMVKNIVNRVLKVVKHVPFVVAQYPVGLHEAVLDFERTTLQSGKSHHTVQILGIWGMGGSGKTTLAKQLYNNKYKNVEKSSFLLDIRDADSKSALHKKQQKLVQDLGLHGVEIENIEEGKGILASRLRCVQVLIILDDVDNRDQMDALVPDKDSLGEGSLIVVTTRKHDVLKSWGISCIYKMKALDPIQARQLFCYHAFLDPFPPSEFENLVQKFIRICDGLPLSLKVFGGQLYGKSDTNYWESQLQKIGRILPDDIISRLKVSYDALDKEEKEAFLDVACFLIGEKKTAAIAAWDGSIGSGLCCWEGLLNKCLVEVGYDPDEVVEVDYYDCIRMHDHLRDLGRQIANQQSPYRLWSPQQIINVDNEMQGIGIRAIMFERAESRSEVEQIPRFSGGGEVIVNTNRGLRTLAPSALGLKFLQIRGNNYNQVIGDLSRDLVWLQWFDNGQRNLGSLNSFKNLRVLELHQDSDIEEDYLQELWVTESNLRELLIYSCEGFERFPESIGCLRHLKKIVARGTRVESLPDEFCRLQSLEHLDLTHCWGLSLLPNNFGDLRNLRHLDLRACWSLEKLPVSFKYLSLLQYLSLWDCSCLSFESNMLETITQLEYLNLYGCRKLEELPCHITNQASLRELNLSKANSLKKIPGNIHRLSKLQDMRIGSELLESLPTSIGDLSSLTSLHIYGCPKLGCLPESLGRLNHIKNLYIQNSGVRSLAVGVRKTSISEDSYPGLESLYLESNDLLTEIDVHSTPLKTMDLRNCKMVRKIRGIDDLVNIRTLKISGCPELDSLPSFAQLACLEHFELVKGCYGVKKLQGLEHCGALEVLIVHTMWEEAGIQNFDRMKRLREVSLVAISRAGVEGCIQNIQRCSERIEICTRAVPDAVSLLSSFDFSNFSVFHVKSNLESNSCIHLGWPNSVRCILLCFVLNCELDLSRDGLDISAASSDEVEEGQMGIYSCHHTTSQIPCKPKPKPKVKVEKGLLLTGAKEGLVEAFKRLCMLLSY